VSEGEREGKTLKNPTTDKLKNISITIKGRLVGWFAYLSFCIALNLYVVRSDDQNLKRES
jgi:hypothetical protein